ncbi:MAG: glycosyltransferase family 2 protein [Candidatus Competibacteraceae bacterium]|nr:MAG: glycosyltransferase family 2 protein [Candidatus Competibacteraceae bacterium]
MIAVVIVNYLKPEMTLECIKSLYKNSQIPFDLFIIDNDSNDESAGLIKDFIQNLDHVSLIVNPDNKGFAGACNQAIELILNSGKDYRAVALLNNDAIAGEDWLDRMYRTLTSDAGIDMVASRMMNHEQPDQIDSLGIVFYKSGIASNRKSLDEPLLGPCGGAALYSVQLLVEIYRASGEIFDEQFFCYAEDTDLALRARALGFHCAMADDAVVFHWGSASSGGGFNEFVAYQGLRNSLFTLVKNLPTGFFLRNAGWLLLMQVAVIFKYLVKGKFSLVWRIYRDFFAGLRPMLAKRRRFFANFSNAPTLATYPISRSFYDHDYLWRSIRSLPRRDIASTRF